MSDIGKKTYPHFLRTASVKLQQYDIERNTILRTLTAKLLLSRLVFSHFIELIRVEDELQRLFYEVETIKNNWSVLCANKNDTLVKYATSGMDENMFVSKSMLKLPDKQLLESFLKRELNQ